MGPADHLLPGGIRLVEVQLTPFESQALQLLLLIQKELEVLVRIQTGADPDAAMAASGLELKMPAVAEEG